MRVKQVALARETLFLSQLLLISQFDWLFAVVDKSPYHAARVNVRFAQCLF